jgi:hypothetical protein
MYEKERSTFHLSIIQLKISKNELQSVIKYTSETYMVFTASASSTSEHLSPLSMPAPLI